MDVTMLCRRSHKKKASPQAALPPPSFGGFTIPPRNVPGKVAKEGSTSAAETHAIDAQMVWEASYRKGAGVALGGREKCEHFQKICVYSWLLSVPKSPKL